jgi:hypothetical protein
MVKEPSVDWTISTTDESLRESLDVQAVDAFLSVEASVQELDICIGMVSEKLRNLGYITRQFEIIHSKILRTDLLV